MARSPVGSNVPAASPTKSPETSAELSSNMGEDEHAKVRGDDHSFSISHGDDDDHSASVEGSVSASGGRGSEDEILRRQQQIACTRCAALFLVLATAAAAGAVTFVLTSRQQEEVLQQQVRFCTESRTMKGMWVSLLTPGLVFFLHISGSSLERRSVVEISGSLRPSDQVSTRHEHLRNRSGCLHQHVLAVLHHVEF